MTEASSPVVHSIFYTIQGEGPFAGRPAVFVRLWGCNLQCPWCDTDYTSIREVMPVEDVVRKVNGEYGERFAVDPLVVITGGEPLRQPIGPLVVALVEAGYRVQLETNGTLPPLKLPLAASAFTHYVVSPKTGTVHPKMAQAADAYKYVITQGEVDGRTGLPTQALGHPAHPQLPAPPERLPRSRVYVQPMDPDPNGGNLKACVSAVLKHGYTLCLQTHKLAGVP